MAIVGPLSLLKFNKKIKLSKILFKDFCFFSFFNKHVIFVGSNCQHLATFSLVRWSKVALTSLSSQRYWHLSFSALDK